MKTVGVYAFSIEDGRSVQQRIAAAVQDFAPDFPPCGRQVYKNKRGKPFFEDSSLQLSISHSGKWWILALAQIPLGVDVQEMRPIRAQALARRFFHPAEVQALEAEAFQGFYQIWTQKESYVKLTGSGIDAHFREFAVQHVPAFFTELLLEEGYVLMVCTEEAVSVDLKYL